MQFGGETRIHGSGFREAISKAFDLIPPAVADKVGHVRFVAGVNPVFVGLHDYAGVAGNAHFCAPHHLNGPANRRVETIVLPHLCSPAVVVHELGHALHRFYSWEPTVKPVSSYAHKDHYKAFTEAFSVKYYPGYLDLFYQPPTELCGFAKWFFEQEEKQGGAPTRESWDRL